MSNYAVIAKKNGNVSILGIGTYKAMKEYKDEISDVANSLGAEVKVVDNDAGLSIISPAMSVQSAFKESAEVSE